MFLILISYIDNLQKKDIAYLHVFNFSIIIYRGKNMSYLKLIYIYIYIVWRRFFLHWKHLCRAMSCYNINFKSDTRIFFHCLWYPLICQNLNFYSQTCAFQLWIRKLPWGQSGGGSGSKTRKDNNKQTNISYSCNKTIIQ